MVNEPADKNRSKAVEMAISQIEKQYGKGAIMKMGDAPRERVPVISTGSISLDYALGVGGLPRGRIIEVFGPEASGKTTVALHVVAECQKAGGTAAFIDAEHALDVDYCEKLGINIDELLLSQPDTGEQALDITELLVRSGAVDLIVIDSVAVLVPRAEIEGEMGDSHVGLQARLMSQALRKLTAILAKSQCCAIFINQIREKIGVMFGNPETTPGGRALKFYSSVRLDIRAINKIKEKEETIGNRTRVKVVKNKVSPPFKQAEFDIIFGRGISREGDLIDLGTEQGIVEKVGTWFTYGKHKLGQGRENAKQYIHDNPDAYAELERDVRVKLGLINSPDSAPVKEEKKEGKKEEKDEKPEKEETKKGKK